MQQFTRQQVNSYIQSKQGSWSAASTASESSRLHSMLAHLSEVEGELLYTALIDKGLKPYTIKTCFVRAGEFLAFVGAKTNPYKRMLAVEAKRFSNSYIPERISLTFADAKVKIEQIAILEHRQLATFILHSGLRATEALKYDGSGWVMGKGARMRRVFNSELAPKLAEAVSYTAFYSSLKAVGLKPHTLRKLAATELAKNGFREADLLHVMGWKSMQTASIYLQPTNDEALEVKIKQAMGL